MTTIDGSPAIITITEAYLRTDSSKKTNVAAEPTAGRGHLQVRKSKGRFILLSSVPSNVRAHFERRETKVVDATGEALVWEYKESDIVDTEWEKFEYGNGHKRWAECGLLHFCHQPPPLCLGRFLFLP